jgi:LCP family protein required for cell wall assembly
MCYSPVDLDTIEPTTGGHGRSPSVAALLSFVWPGLGQLYLANRRAAVLFAAPAFLALLLFLYEMRQGLLTFAARFVDPTFSRVAAVLVVLLGAWRVWSVVHAFIASRRPSLRFLDKAVVVALVAVIVISHAGAGIFLAATSDAGGHAFNPESSFVDLTTPPPSTASLGPSQTLGPSATPVPTPSIDSRVTILFTGFDAGPGRQEILYDSLLVVSYDPVTNSVEMVSLPRDSTSFPLYFGSHRVVPTSLRLNSVPTNVSKRGITGSPDSPYMTLVNEIGYLLGIHIDYYAAMDLLGFVAMIDQVGGIDVVNPTAINDPYYDWLNGAPYGFSLAAGPQHLDGKHALAYVRSRKSAGDNDFGRSSRQQEVLISLLHKMAQPSQILNLPGLISTLGSSVTTNFPSDKVADYIAIGQGVSSANFHDAVLSPTAGYSEYLPSGALCLFNARVATLSVQLFGTDSLWSGKPPPANTCPA